MTFNRLIWNLACFLWVAAPVISFWPGAHPRSSQFVWWVLASILVIACSFCEPPTYPAIPIALLMTAFACVFFVHGFFLYDGKRFGFATAWIMKTSLICAAAILISERSSWRFLFDCLLVLLALQIPILIAEYAGIKTPWYVKSFYRGDGITWEGGRPNGSLYCRAGLSILAGFCSIWLSGLKSLLCGAMACASTSLSGAIPSIARLVYRPGRYGRRVALGGIGAFLLIALIFGARFSSRLEAWGNALDVIRNHWLAGAGFLPIPGSFREDTLGGAALGPVQFTDFHSTSIDWLARFGLVGLLAISPLMIWVVKRTFSQPTPWKVWTLLFFIFAGSSQSVEGIYVIGLLGIVWLIRLAQEERVFAC